MVHVEFRCVGYTFVLKQMNVFCRLSVALLRHSDMLRFALPFTGVFAKPDGRVVQEERPAAVFQGLRG